MATRTQGNKRDRHLSPSQIGALAAHVLFCIKTYPCPPARVLRIRKDWIADRPERWEVELRRRVNDAALLPNMKSIETYNGDVLELLVMYYSEKGPR